MWKSSKDIRSDITQVRAHLEWKKQFSRTKEVFRQCEDFGKRGKSALTSEQMQGSAEDPYKRPLRLLELAPDWQAMISSLISKDPQHLAVMVCGPKGSGKSTFCRTLVNALLSKASIKHQFSEQKPESDCVAFLDLDPGQPEYSPPGEISLHKLRSYSFGPPFTHPTSNGSDGLIKAHHYGYLSPKEDSYHYYRCALDLFSRYKRLLAESRSCPLIINCSGWIQGSGLGLLVNLIEDFELTDIIYTSTNGPEEVTDALSEAAKRSDTPLHQLTSQTPEITTRTAADLRMMQTLSYFHLDEPEANLLRWNASPLTNIPPLVVHYAGPKQGISAVMVLGDEQNPEFLESILEGCVVGIVAVDEDLAADWEIDMESDIPNGHETDVEVDGSASIGINLGHNAGNTASSISNPHPTIRRTPTGIPYLPSKNHTTPPLPPSRSHSLGQALIRSIDTQTRTLLLLTPLSPSTLPSTHQKLVLVRGKLDTPTWAYAEEFELEKAGRRGRERVTGEREEGEGGVREWAGTQPWACAVEGGRTGSARVRRVRRDIRYKGQKDG